MTRSAASVGDRGDEGRQGGRVVRPVGVHLDDDRRPARRARRRTRRGRPCPGPACPAMPDPDPRVVRAELLGERRRSRRASCRRRRAASRRAGDSRIAAAIAGRGSRLVVGRQDDPGALAEACRRCRLGSRRSSGWSVGGARGPGPQDRSFAGRSPDAHRRLGRVPAARLVGRDHADRRRCPAARADRERRLPRPVVELACRHRDAASRPGWRNVTRGFVDSGSTERNRTTERLARPSRPCGSG